MRTRRPARYTRGWWIPAVGAGVVLGALVAAVALTLGGYWNQRWSDWRWPAAVGAAAVLSAVLLLIASLMRERGARILRERQQASEELTQMLTVAPGPTLVPVRGYVRDGDAAPVPEAALTLIDQSGGQRAHCRTGADGWYQLTVPVSGAYTLITRARGHQPKACAVTVGTDPVELDLVLAGTAAVAGTAYAAGSGRVLPGATAVLMDATGEVLAALVAGEDGTFRFDDVMAGGHTVVVSAAGHRPAALPVLVPTAGTVRCDATLAGAASLAGTARARRDNRPLPDAMITVFDERGDRAAQTVTDDDGRFRCDELADGEYTVVASGFPAVVSRVRLAAGEHHEHDVALGHLPSLPDRPAPPSRWTQPDPPTTAPQSPPAPHSSPPAGRVSAARYDVRPQVTGDWPGLP